MESRRGEKSGPRTILGLARTGLLAVEGPWHPAPVDLDESERTRGDSAMSLESQTGPPEPGQKLSISASPTWDEASIPQASAPAWTGCLLPY